MSINVPNKPASIYPIPELSLLASSDWSEYALLDSGGGRKLERYGPYTFTRPEHQAIWNPVLPSEEWRSAHAEFQTTGGETGGEWNFKKNVKSPWLMNYKGLRFQAQTTLSRHMGVFPEQANHWDWISEQIQNAQTSTRVLNLFGYTGLATLAAAQAGANVTHVDASKKVISIARENQQLSNLQNCPIRWLVDDAFKFVRREIRRGSKYEGIILDPPKFGRGPKGQVWEFFESFSNLLRDCRAILSEEPLFIVVTAYAIRASALSIYYDLQENLSGLGGETETGELVLEEQSAGRLLSTAIFVRWSADKP